MKLGEGRKGLTSSDYGFAWGDTGRHGGVTCEFMNIEKSSERCNLKGLII